MSLRSSTNQLVATDIGQPAGTRRADTHERIFVIEGGPTTREFKSLMMIELGINPDKLVSVLNYDGTPITADDILNQIKGGL